MGSYRQLIKRGDMHKVHIASTFLILYIPRLLVINQMIPYTPTIINIPTIPHIMCCFPVSCASGESALDIKVITPHTKYKSASAKSKVTKGFRISSLKVVRNESTASAYAIKGNNADSKNPNIRLSFGVIIFINLY